MVRVRAFWAGGRPGGGVEMKKGDARIYHLSDGKLVQIRKDHAWYVVEYGPKRPVILSEFPTFRAARQFIRMARNGKRKLKE
jgi:hypothetical protein